MNDPRANRGDEPNPSPLHTRELTWAALIGHWAAFAKSALALPLDAPGRALRE